MKCNNIQILCINIINYKDFIYYINCHMGVYISYFRTFMFMPPKIKLWYKLNFLILKFKVRSFINNTEFRKFFKNFRQIQHRQQKQRIPQSTTMNDASVIVEPPTFQTNTINKFFIFKNFKINKWKHSQTVFSLKLFFDSEELGDCISKNIKDINKN